MSSSASQRGAIALMMATYILAIILLIALTAANIIVFEYRMSREISYSISALFAADAGAEKCLCQARKNAIFPAQCAGGCASISGNTAVTLDNGATASATRVANKRIESRGLHSLIYREVELNWN